MIIGKYIPLPDNSASLSIVPLRDKEPPDQKSVCIVNHVNTTLHVAPCSHFRAFSHSVTVPVNPKATAISYALEPSVPVAQVAPVGQGISCPPTRIKLL